MSQSAFAPPTRAGRPHTDVFEGGAITWARRYDETETYGVDISDRLAEGETCTAIAMINVSGPTLGDRSVSPGGTISVTVTKGQGTATARVTTSAGRSLEFPLQWRATDRPGRDAYRW